MASPATGYLAKSWTITERRDGDHFEMFIARSCQRIGAACRTPTSGLEDVVRFGADPGFHHASPAISWPGSGYRRSRRSCRGIKCGSSLLVYTPANGPLVDVVGAVHQPVGVKDDDGIHTQLAKAPLADFFMPDRWPWRQCGFPRQFRRYIDGTWVILPLALISHQTPILGSDGRPSELQTFFISRERFKAVFARPSRPVPEAFRRQTA